ncbi:hypothetical protein [Cecembia calidifontis]|jgi:hypothetical protein|uniref:Uncharacterized protein n=1 Tax=Cecembia calidifontis TaxID=1187080 RepID=A0A4Q7P6Q9_9BACT|nr:hypothetical protein [Cecembia calidifontis]RZS95208.1 hypothetical protein BC751_0725 [Cecembia calidifontis]
MEKGRLHGILAGALGFWMVILSITFPLFPKDYNDNLTASTSQSDELAPREFSSHFLLSWDGLEKPNFPTKAYWTAVAFLSGAWYAIHALTESLNTCHRNQQWIELAFGVREMKFPTHFFW